MKNKDSLSASHYTLPKKKQPSKCYNCGRAFSEREMTREHIPAQNLYVGFDSKFKINRIVVPACFSCNNYYSQFDHVIRQALGYKQRELDNEYHTKIYNATNRVKEWSNRYYISRNNVIAVNFNVELLRTLFIKNFKGVFLDTYKVILPKNYHLICLLEGEKLPNILDGIHLRKIKKEFRKDAIEISGHEGIFKYKLLPIDINRNNRINWKEAEVILGWFCYHNRLRCLVFAVKNKKRQYNYSTQKAQT